MLDHSRSPLSFPNDKERTHVPAIPPYFIEPIFEQFVSLLPEQKVNHPLGCHRSRIPEAGWSSISWYRSWCSATPLRDRRKE
jgi:hypothetical protein